jgi:hypothetical protein
MIVTKNGKKFEFSLSSYEAERLAYLLFEFNEIFSDSRAFAVERKLATMLSNEIQHVFRREKTLARFHGTE